MQIAKTYKQKNRVKTLEIIIIVELHWVNERERKNDDDTKNTKKKNS